MRISQLFIPVAIILIVLLSGPLLHFKPAPVAMELPITSADQLDDYIAGSEGKISGLRSELAKSVLWASVTSRQPTKYSIVYLHGFTASRRDISPVIEKLASDIGANTFLTRLKAHGLQNGDEFAKVKAADWYNDAREAFAIGKLIGQKVILVGTSTGGLLATLVALDKEAQSSIAALVLLSPNFGLSDWRAKFISGPLGKHLARRLIGVERITLPDNEGHARVWTHRYRSEGIAALMDLTNFIRGKDLYDIAVPTLVLYTEKDKILDVGAIKERFETIISKSKRLVDVVAADRHELTGEILAPDTVGPVLQSIEGFLNQEAGVGFAKPIAAHAGP